MGIKGKKYITIFSEWGGTFAYASDKPGCLGDCIGQKMCEEHDGMLNNVLEFQTAYGITDGLTRDLCKFADDFDETIDHREMENDAGLSHGITEKLLAFDERAESLARRFKIETGGRFHVQCGKWIPLPIHVRKV